MQTVLKTKTTHRSLLVAHHAANDAQSSKIAPRKTTAYDLPQYADQSQNAVTFDGAMSW